MEAYQAPPVLTPAFAAIRKKKKEHNPFFRAFESFADELSHFLQDLECGLPGFGNLSLFPWEAVKELDQIQKRLLKLIDMHIDGDIDSDSYHAKLEEYKKRQRSLKNQMRKDINGDEKCLIKAKTVLDLAKGAREIFMSSKLKEKQQLLNFVFSNLKLDGKRLSVTLREPFSTLIAVSHQAANLRILDSNYD